jgi:hypothetical protein
MNDRTGTRTLAFIALAALAAAAARAQFTPDPDATEINLSGRTPETVIIGWPMQSYRLARMMISEYGQPSEVRDASLTWLGTKPWSRIVVYREAPADSRGRGRLEQSAAYRMTPGREDSLASFDPTVASSDGLLTARADSESENFLALNLADDVVNGRRSPRQASALRARLLKLWNSGKSSPYLERLLF